MLGDACLRIVMGFLADRCEVQVRGSTGREICDR